MQRIVLGIDFDNTIVDYDLLFHRVAVERDLVPSGLQASKGAVRDYLRNNGQEDDWTEMQGYVYGARMAEAAPFSGVLECLAHFVKKGLCISIISHKTRHPYRGPQYDLHMAAWEWLEQQGFFDKARIGLTRNEVFFEETKKAKLQRIAECECTHFIDDLPEFLNEPDFPPGATRILFDPYSRGMEISGIIGIDSWRGLEDYFGAD
jgi:hypothetical protein